MARSKSNEPAEEPTFEEAFGRLGETVQTLESGGLTLEAATALYEEGMRLVQLCNRLLSKTELKVSELKEAYSDYLAEVLQEEQE